MTFFRFRFVILFAFLLLRRSLALTPDGILLLSFKYSILSDPLSVLESWNYGDVTPCSWTGVTCSAVYDDGDGSTVATLRVTSLALPKCQLLGPITMEIGMIEHLRNLELSNNFINGSLPESIFNASELQVLSLSSNAISGELPESISGLKSIQLLNLSDNALGGKVPENLTTLQNLTVVSLRSNYFSGTIPKGFDSVQVLDLSSNLINSTLPLNFGGGNLRYLNLSYNKISGSIPPDFAKKIPINTTLDLSFNNLSGAIPESLPLLHQKAELFAGNDNLCGKPLKNLCSVPSTLSSSPLNISSASSSSSPAIAAIPRTISSNPDKSNSTQSPNRVQNTQSQGRIKPSKIAAIIMGDLAGMVLLAMAILYIYQFRKRKNQNPSKNPEVEVNSSKQLTTSWSDCFSINLGEEKSESISSEKELELHEDAKTERGENRGVFVTVDGETELELETLLKASAYILGNSVGSIVYKAVIEDGTAFAVRRIGESGIESVREFEKQVRVIAKIRHPNLVKVRGFYWGDDEKLVVYEYVSNGCLATTNYRRSDKFPGSSTHLPLEARFKIARGIAHGIAYIHDKKHVHGNVKPNNILLNSDMEPLISDFGLERLVFGSSRFNLGNQRPSTPGREGGGSPAGAGRFSSAYQAPESLNNLKPNPKWDVYSFGMILLELLTARVLSVSELGQWSGWNGSGMGNEERNRVVMMADVAIRGDMEGREDAMVACFKVGFGCVSFNPQKRPNMKEVVQVMDKISLAS